VASVLGGAAVVGKSRLIGPRRPSPFGALKARAWLVRGKASYFKRQTVSLLEEARHFRITRLQNWLEKRCYLEAVKVQHTHHGDTRRESHKTWSASTLSSDTTIHYYPSWGDSKGLRLSLGTICAQWQARRLRKGTFGRPRVTRMMDYEEEPCVRSLQ
jgi:hypothetical protein